MTLNLDLQSPTWRALKRHLIERIVELQGFLEAPSDREATAALRGQIKELRMLIERVDPSVSEETSEITSRASLY